MTQLIANQIKAKFKSLFPVEKHPEIDAFGKDGIQEWLKSNLSRIEFLIADAGEPFSLNLLEALAQFQLRPMFEGKNA